MSFIGTTLIGLEKAAINEIDGELHSPGRITFSDYDPKQKYLTLNTIYEKIL